MKTEQTPLEPNTPYGTLAKEASHKPEASWFRAVIEFTQAVAKRMAALGVTRKQLAQRLDVHPSLITKVLRGDSNISVETIAKLSHALDCDFQIKMMPKPSFFDEAFILAPQTHNPGGENVPAPPGLSRLRTGGNLLAYSSPYNG